MNKHNKMPASNKCCKETEKEIRLWCYFIQTDKTRVRGESWVILLGSTQPPNKRFLFISHYMVMPDWLGDFLYVSGIRMIEKP